MERRSARSATWTRSQCCSSRQGGAKETTRLNLSASSAPSVRRGPRPAIGRLGLALSCSTTDRDDDRLPWCAGIARHAYPDYRCCPDSHRSRLGARCDYGDRRGPGRVREAQRGAAHRVQRAEVPQCPAALSGRGSPQLAPPAGGQSSRGGCPTRTSAAEYPDARGSRPGRVPPAVGRGRGPGLQRGRNPRGWKADVRYVPSSENRSHGATLGDRLEPFCNGTRFRYVFR
jgi:hypothetical protein